MTERATISQIVQLGVETTSGDPVDATAKLQSVGFTFAPQFETRVVRPSGSKYATLAILGKDWTQLGIAGDASYEDLMFLFSGVLTAEEEGGTGSTHTYTPSIVGTDTPTTLTVQKGEVAGDAEEVAGVAVNELSLSFTRDAVEVGGSAFGKAIAFNATMTDSVPALELTPVLPADVCVYWDSTSGAVGTTKLLRTMQATWAVTNRFTPLWVLDCEEDSYVATIEAVPEVNVSLLMEADAQAVDFVDNYLRVGSRGYCRIQADRDTGYGLSIDTALTVVSTGELGDQDGVYAISINLTGVADPNWGTEGQVLQVVLENATSFGGS